MKKYHYLTILVLLLVGTAGGFYAGSRYSDSMYSVTYNNSIDDKNYQDESKEQQQSQEEASLSPLSDSVEVASKDNIDINTVFGVDIFIIDKTIQMLEEEYIEDINYKALINGAVSGLKKRLVDEKLSYNFVTPAKQNLTKKEMLAHLHKLYNSAVAVNGKKISESALAYGALSGMLEALNDSYSVVLEPKEYKLLNEFMSGGNYGGIGIYLEVHKKNSMLTVVDTIMGSPAARAGLKSGDVVVKLNGNSVKGMDLELASKKIRGKKGTSVTLLVDRASEGLKEYSIIRDVIHENSVISSMKPGRIGYIKVGLFGDNTGNEFKEQLDKLNSEGAKGLILDLRNNTGGYISAAIDVCSHLMESGSLIVSVVNPRVARNEVYRAYGSKQSQLPIIVLVNENSASASEISAGALKDSGTAKVLGMKTYGKGVVQSIRELRDGGAIKFTIAKYLTPKGFDINKKGILPDIALNMEPQYVNTAQDIQRDKALELLKAQIAKQPKIKPTQKEPPIIPEPESDDLSR